MSLIESINSFVNTYIVSKETQESIKNGLVETANRIIEFILDNKSLVFFGLTVLFSYYMAPASAFEYMSQYGISLKETFVEGALFGAVALIFKNLFSKKSISSNQNDKLNYLAGIVNIGQTYLSPTYGLISSVANSGFIAIKALYNLFIASDEKDSTGERNLYLMLDMDGKSI